MVLVVLEMRRERQVEIEKIGCPIVSREEQNTIVFSKRSELFIKLAINIGLQVTKKELHYVRARIKSR